MCRLSCPQGSRVREQKSPRQTLSWELMTGQCRLRFLLFFQGTLSLSVSTCYRTSVGPHLSLCFNFKPTSSIAFLRVHSIHAVPMKAFSKFVIKRKSSCFHHLKVIFNGNLLLHNSRASPLHNKWLMLGSFLILHLRCILVGRAVKFQVLDHSPRTLGQS